MIEQKQLDVALRLILEQTEAHPSLALVLGSGLGDFTDELTVSASIPTSQIPYYPRSTVQGHEGRLVFGHIKQGARKSQPLLVFKGRVHFYETASLPPVVFPIQVASALGAKSLIVTNAAGGINRKFRPGDLMVIRDILDLTFLKSRYKLDLDQIKSSTLERPLAYPDDIFDPRLTGTLQTISSKMGIDLQEGTYCWLKGPTYETAAEIEMLRRIGADAVGMSTVPEILAARQLGMHVAGISLISNLATGITGEKLSHSEVTNTANRVKRTFTQLMKNFLMEV
ncbi:MAG: purine-nucleoside phosphorylase [Nitrososphaera sp.]|nr:purine-nucleoside phosphorylase [Nitrososphaera sp.]MCI0705899.1 purine-nucleoside phosphorylase [Ignavibacteriota bacterium]